MMNRSLYQITLMGMALTAGLAGLAAPSDRPAPGVPRMQLTAFETQDYLITTHDIRDYGAVADDDKDDTDSFQNAIDACELDGGGIIFVPAGKYAFHQRLEMKPGVQLRGEWRSPEEGPSAGTLLCIYYGKNDPEGEPFIDLAESCGFKDMAFWYPEQSFEEPVPYAWTMQQKGGLSVGLENLTFYNSWQGIWTGPKGTQLLTGKNLYITALHIGFFRDIVYDCQKFSKIYLGPKHWVNSGLPGAPKTAAQENKLRAFLLKESTGAIIAHYDWTWMYDWTVEGFRTGIKVMKSPHDEDTYRGPNGGFVNVRLIDNFVGMEIGDINRCGWADMELTIRSKLKDAIGILITPKLKSTVQYQNVTFEGSFKYCVLSQSSWGVVSLAGCTFDGWEEYAVHAASGVVQLFGNSFKQRGNHVFLGSKVQNASILGNRFSGDADIKNVAPSSAVIDIDHDRLDLELCDLSGFEYPEAIHKPVKPDLFNVRDFGAKGDMKHSDHDAFVNALNAAEKNGGGTVYVPVGRYVLKKELVIPSNVELRGVFDNSHHTKKGHGFRRRNDVLTGQRGSELFAYPGKGNKDGTPFVRLEAGSSIRGLTIFYPEQKWSDFLKDKEFTPFPWTIQSLGPNTRLKDVLLVNAYQGADFGTYDSTGHRIDYLCGAPLKTGLYVDNCYGKGYVKNCQFNPSFWAWSGYPDRAESCDGLRNEIAHTLTAFKFGYSEQESMMHNFSFGSLVGIEFLSNEQHGGFNGVIVAHGIDHSATSMIFNDVGNDAQFVNFQIVSMEVDERRRYLDIRDTVKGKAKFYSLLGWGHGPCAEIGIEQQSGEFYFLLSSFASHATDYGIKQTGGKLTSIGMRFGEAIQIPIFGGYTSGLYGIFGKEIERAELIGTVKKTDIPDGEAFINKAGLKLKMTHSISHDGF